VLNEVFSGEILQLSARFNMYTEYFEFSFDEIERYRAGLFAYSKDEIASAMEEPAVIHLTDSFLTARPWFEGSRHPFAAKWLAYKEGSPWKDEPLWKNGKSIEKRALLWICGQNRALGVMLAGVANSFVRPLMDWGIGWLLRLLTAVKRL